MIPLVSPEEFLSGMPFVNISIFGNKYISIQPSSTFFVYALGIIMIAIGIYFLRTKGSQRSRSYWGISALVAGTSYQAFGYELKCRGQEYCLYTRNFELVYMLLTAYCINFLVVATGYTSVGEVGRKKLINFAVVYNIIYLVYMFIGAIIPIKVLISYEGFISFIGVNFLIMFILNIRHYIRNKDDVNRNSIIIWFSFLLVNVGYFVYMFSGFSFYLYSNYDLWFNENDILHVLLIFWALLIFLLFRKELKNTEAIL